MIRGMAGSNKKEIGREDERENIKRSLKGEVRRVE
jgi:hypothetical protein